MALSRKFVLLQGPHGPFFARLSKMLRLAGADCHRIVFNGGDLFFAGDKRHLTCFDGAVQDWESWFQAFVEDQGISDLVLYGEPRPLHASALKIARERGLTCHIFEEGYLRPYWVTYEREGSNGNSRLMSLSDSDIDAALGDFPGELTEVPTHWGDMRQHVFYGALYHACVMARARRFPKYQPHRGIALSREFSLNLRRLLFMPWHHLRRAVSDYRLRRGGYPFHLALLQLDHDASFRAHSSFGSTSDFIAETLAGFAKGAPPHHHLVFKAHPLEDGRVPLARDIKQMSRDLGLTGRVHFQIGGKLAPLLDSASSAVTVNSTAAQQALWRGLPVKIFGSAVYDKPELVSHQPLAEFFAAPQLPDRAAYLRFRKFLLLTSQIKGGFYSSKGRLSLLRQVVDMMLDPQTPYEKLQNSGAAAPQQMRVIHSI